MIQINIHPENGGCMKGRAIQDLEAVGPVNRAAKPGRQGSWTVRKVFSRLLPP